MKKRSEDKLLREATLLAPKKPVPEQQRKSQTEAMVQQLRARKRN